jgi:DNA polymerase-3 subunit epsilon
MDNFVAIDLETANSDKTSICEIGLVKFLNGVPYATAETLIRPMGEIRFDVHNQMIHGITIEDVVDAPLLGDVWAELESFIGGLPLVGHNFTQDLNKIIATLGEQNVRMADHYYYCTMTMARQMEEFQGSETMGLSDLADFAGITWMETQRADGSCGHGAVNDAQATGELFVQITKARNLTMAALLDALDMRAGEISNGLVLNGNTKKKDNSFWAIQTFGTKEFQVLLEQLASDDLFPSTEHHFSGQNIVLSLFPQSLNLQQFWTCVALAGGNLKTGVTKKVNYLVECDDPSGKYVKGQTGKSKDARELIDQGFQELRIIEESEFLDLIGSEILAIALSR